MALGALVMIIIAFSYAYMVPKYPKTGGEFTFIKMCFGRNTAYVRGSNCRWLRWISRYFKMGVALSGGR